MKSLRVRCRDAIHMALLYRGWKQVELARRLGVSAAYVSNLLKGGENLTLGQLERVLGTLGFKLDVWLRRARK